MSSLSIESQLEEIQIKLRQHDEIFTNLNQLNFKFEKKFETLEDFIKKIVEKVNLYFISILKINLFNFDIIFKDFRR